MINKGIGDLEILKGYNSNLVFFKVHINVRYHSFSGMLHRVSRDFV